MKYFPGFYLIIITANIIQTGCVSEDVREAPVTPSEVLNQWVNSAPYQYINLDYFDAQEIKLIEEDIIYNINSDPVPGDPLIGQLTYFTYIQQHFYIFDRRANSIFQIQQNGRAKGPLTREGSGPGEHLYITGIWANSHYVYAPDGNNGRINLYTHNMESDGLFSGYLYGPIDLNDEIIVTRNRLNGMISSDRSDEKLISIFPLGNLEDTLVTILPRIVPPGYQPGIFNNALFSVNNNNLIVASYIPWPWLFLFDENYKLARTLILESEVLNKMDLVPLNFFKPKGNDGFGGIIPLIQYMLDDKGDLFITLPGGLMEQSSSTTGNDLPFQSEYRVDYNQLVHLAPESSGSYQIKGIYKFRVHDGDILTLMEMVSAEEENTFYGRDLEHLFRFRLPE